MHKRNFFGTLACLAVLAISHGTTYSAQHDGPDIRDCTAIQPNELLADASALYDKGSFADAANLAEKAAQIREQCLGANDPATAEALNLSGRYYRYAGQYKKARQLLDRALSIRTMLFGEESVQVADTLNNLGGVDYFELDPASPEARFAKALEIRSKTLGKDHPDTIVSMQNMAVIYLNTGRLTQAKTIIEQVLGLQESSSTVDSAAVAKSYSLLAEIYEGECDFMNSERLFHKARLLSEQSRGAEHRETIRTRLGLGWSIYNLGDYRRAEMLISSALASYESTVGANHLSTAAALTSLALLYSKTGRYGMALPLELRALNIRETILGKSHRDTAAALNNLGELYIATKQYEEADAALLRALTIKEKLIPQSLGYATTMLNLGILHSRVGRTSEAATEIKAALDIRGRILSRNHPLTAEAVMELGTLEWSRANYEAARELYEQAQNIRFTISNHLLPSLSESRNEAYLRTLTDHTNRFISFALEFPSARSNALAFESSVYFKGRALTTTSDNLTNVRLESNKSNPQLLERRAMLARQLSALMYQSTDAIEPGEYKLRLEQLNREFENLDSQLSRRDIQTTRREKRLDMSTIRDAIPSNAAVIEITRYTPYSPVSKEAKSLPHYAAFVISRDQDVVVVDLGTAQAIESGASAFRRAVLGSDPELLRTRSIELSKLITHPLTSHIRGKQQLLISADGVLNLVPIAALLDEKGEYLADHYVISYLSSTRDLFRFDHNSRARNEATIVADPDFGPTIQNGAAQFIAQQSVTRSSDLDRSGVIFRSLPNTAIEARELQHLLRLDKSEVYLGADATESALKTLSGPRILHIASHGFFLSDQSPITAEEYSSRSNSALVQLENPLLRSGLALSGANTRHSANGEDGILTALEVAQMDLHGTQLVVLSACDSGVGDIKNGEGVYGLRRALVLAGAQTQVTSLWKVSDEATRHLMVSFYRRLAEGAGRAEALAEAQREMIKSREYSHPYYWASFIPSGDWSPLPKTH